MTPSLTKSKVEGLLEKFQQLRIWVIGDVMLDRFLWGKVERISPEAPVPVVNVTSEEMMPGGAANVASNLAGLGTKVTIIGIVGKDAEGKSLVKLLNKRKIATDGIISAAGRPTTIKTRVVAHGQHVVRFDREEAHPIPTRIRDRILDFFNENKHSFDALIVSDYGKGLISEELFASLADFCISKNCLLSVDPHIHHFWFYRRASLITPNQHQFETALNCKCRNQKELELKGQDVLKKLELKYLVVTQGERGMTVFERNSRAHMLPTFAKQVYDVTGAGDTVIATLTTALAAKSGISEAATLANIAAGAVVEEVGTTAINREKLLSHLKESGL